MNALKTAGNGNATTAGKPLVPPFTIGQVRPHTLVHAFLERRILNLDNPPPIIEVNGHKYQADYTDIRLTLTELENKESLFKNCIISCQKHTYGSYAIVRVSKVGPKTHGEQND